MTDEEKRALTERELAQAEKDQLGDFKTKIDELLEKTTEGHNSDLLLNEAQRAWVEEQLGKALREDMILNDSNNPNDYVEFTQSHKDAFKPAIEHGLKLKILNAGNSIVSDHLEGGFYKGVQDLMQGCGVRKFRGFCKLTGRSHTTVYRKIKIAANYTRESLENHPGVDLKALYEVAANCEKKGSRAADVLAQNHAALANAGSDVHEVRRVLDPEYKRETNIVKPDGVAVTPDERLKAEFSLRKARIIVQGVFERDWVDFQLWFQNPDLWGHFMAWKKLKEQEAEEELETQGDNGESEDAADEPFTSEELCTMCESQWSNPNAVEDDGTIDISQLYGADDPTDFSHLRGEVFIRCSENGTPILLRDNIFSKDFPLTSQKDAEFVDRIRQDYPQATDIMFIDAKEQFVVGTKILDGNPVTRWTAAAQK